MLSPETIAAMDAGLILRQMRKECADLQRMNFDESSWITIGGKPDAKGHKHAGGAPVKVSPKGNITAGPAPLKGKNIDHLPYSGPKAIQAKPTPTPEPPPEEEVSEAERHGIDVPMSKDDADKLAKLIRKYAIDQYGKDLKNQCRSITEDIYEAFKPYVEIFEGTYPGDYEEGGHHYVPMVNGYLIDVSADQFGGPKISILPEDEIDGHPEYGSFRRSTIAEKTHHSLSGKVVSKMMSDIRGVRKSAASVAFSDFSGDEWITIGAQRGSDGKKHGGSPVKLDEGGDIEAGPAKLKGRKIGDLKKNLRPQKPYENIGTQRNEDKAVEVDKDLATAAKLGRLTLPTHGYALDPHLEDAYRRAAEKQGVKLGKFEI